MMHNYTLFLLYTFACICYSKVTIKSAVLPSDKPAVKQNVTISIQLIGKKVTRLEIYHNDAQIGEDCLQYEQSNLLKVSCNRNIPDRFEITLQLPNIQWISRGNYSFKYLTDEKVVNLDVQIPPAIDLYMKVPLGDSIQGVSSKAAVPVMGGSDKRRPLFIGNNSILLSCRTKCTYPDPDMRWFFQNSTDQGPIESTREKTRPIECITGQSSLEINLDLHCSNLGLYGLNKISCKPFVNDLRHHQRFIYLVCPAATPISVFDLTQGEVIAMLMGGVLGLFVMIAIGCLLWRRRHEFGDHETKLPQDTLL